MLTLVFLGLAPAAAQSLDPAAWGQNHAGQPVPEYIDGEECLFCHRNEVGTTWQDNRHGRTVRFLLDDEAARQTARFAREQPEASAQATHILGGGEHTRLLKRLRPGKFALLEADGWNENQFGDNCAGCHSTGIDSKTKLFFGVGHDCYACHGKVALEHSGDTSLVWLSEEKRGDAKVITSICAQCHLRGGNSKTSGLPYANTFLAGDNLFQDYEVDWDLADDPDLNPADRHVYFNARSVALGGSEKPHCLSCHRMHSDEGNRHRRVLRTEVCWVCHEEARKIGPPFEYEVHSAACEY